MRAPRAGWGLPWRLARRELRSGLKGFGVFLACLALGVAAIAAVGMVRAAIERGLSDQGAILLGGDAQVEFTYRFANEGEKAWLAEKSIALSEIVDFRSMAVVGEAHVLVAVKAVDDAYPLYGAVQLDSGLALPDALGSAGAGAVPGGVMERILADQLGLVVGQRFSLGTQEFRLTGILTREPDSALGGFSMAPRLIVRRADLANSGLLVEGTLFDSAYRMKLPPGADFDALQQEAEAKFREQGLRWQGQPRGRTRCGTLCAADWRVSGSGGPCRHGGGRRGRGFGRARLSGGQDFHHRHPAHAGGGRDHDLSHLSVADHHLDRVGAGAGSGAGDGVAHGLGRLDRGAAALPAEVGFYPRPLFEALFYGATSALLFALWPLARAADIRAAALYRGGLGGGRPRGAYLVAIVGLALLLVGGAVWLSGMVGLALSTAGGILGALVLLSLAAYGLRKLARWLAKSRAVQGHTAWRLALASIGAPRSETGQVVLALGLGLSVLAALGQIDANLRAAIATDLPARAPSFFFVDIQPDQIDSFRATLQANPQVSKLETAPMLRGLITKINGRDARKVAGNHWVVMGDRGITYAATPPEGTTLTAGTWWPQDYTGPAQISFAAREAEEMGVTLGDKVTVNILGREIEATITSFRAVDFSSAGMGFVMVMNPAAVQAAPHSHIATVYATETAEAPLLRQLTKTYPNITAIGVKAAIGRVTETLTAIGQAITLAALVTLATGFVVLVGAAAAGERNRRYEAAILKTLGASRALILWSFALRAGLTGAAAGLVAIVTGVLSGWAVMVFVMDSPYHLQPGSALAIILGGVLATLVSSLVFMLRPLAARPAQVLRDQE